MRVFECDLELSWIEAGSCINRETASTALQVSVNLGEEGQYIINWVLHIYTCYMYTCTQSYTKQIFCNILIVVMVSILIREIY